MFTCELYDPDQWADVFYRSGAKYIVLTSKHHEGFCLWPNAEASRTWGRPWNAVETVVAELGDLSGKIVIDCTNPLGPVDGTFGLTMGHTTSGGETVQRLLPGARVVKTLNQVGAEIMARNDHLPQRPAMLMAGNDEAARDAVAGLLRDIGFDPLDAGDITKSRLREPFALVWINQALARGKGRDWAFAAIS